MGKYAARGSGLSRVVLRPTRKVDWLLCVISCELSQAKLRCGGERYCRFCLRQNRNDNTVVVVVVVPCPFVVLGIICVFVC